MTDRRILSGQYLIDERGFTYTTGRGKSREVHTLTIDEFLVSMRHLIRSMREQEDMDARLSYARSLAEDFEALDDWLSSGNRPAPKSWQFAPEP